MNVKQLRDLLATCPDNMPVLVDGWDHSYLPAYGGVTFAGKPPGKNTDYYQAEKKEYLVDEKDEHVQILHIGAG